MRKQNPDATTLIPINQYNADKQNLEKEIGDVDKKITDLSDLVTTTVLNTKISKNENKIPDTSLMTETALNTKISEVENKTPDNSKYITTEEFNKLTAEHFAARSKLANLVNTTEFDNELTSFNKRITSNKTQHFKVQKKLNSLIRKDYDFVKGRMYFTGNDGSQNTIVYQPTLDKLELKKKNKGTNYDLHSIKLSGY